MASTANTHRAPRRLLTLLFGLAALGMLLALPTNADARRIRVKRSRLNQTRHLSQLRVKRFRIRRRLRTRRPRVRFISRRPTPSLKRRRVVGIVSRRVKLQRPSGNRIGHRARRQAKRNQRHVERGDRANVTVVRSWMTPQRKASVRYFAKAIRTLERRHAVAKAKPWRVWRP
jgi:hypothetical protein